jgi:hypothetical protein
VREMRSRGRGREGASMIAAQCGVLRCMLDRYVKVVCVTSHQNHIMTTSNCVCVRVCVCVCVCVCVVWCGVVWCGVMCLHMYACEL